MPFDTCALRGHARRTWHIVSMYSHIDAIFMEFPTQDGGTPAMSAAVHGNAEAIRALVAFGAELNTQVASGSCDRCYSGWDGVVRCALGRAIRPHASPTMGPAQSKNSHGTTARNNTHARIHAHTQNHHTHRRTSHRQPPAPPPLDGAQRCPQRSCFVCSQSALGWARTPVPCRTRTGGLRSCTRSQKASPRRCPWHPTLAHDRARALAQTRAPATAVAGPRRPKPRRRRGRTRQRSTCGFARRA